MALVRLPGKEKTNAYLIQGRDDPMPLRQPLTKFEDRTKSCQGRQMSTVAYYKETLKVFFNYMFDVFMTSDLGTYQLFATKEVC